MITFNKNEIGTVYPVCRTILGENSWAEALKEIDTAIDHQDLMEIFEGRSYSDKNIPSYIYDIARLELAEYMAGIHDTEMAGDINKIELNPTLEILQFTRNILSVFFRIKEGVPVGEPEEGDEWVFVWKDIRTGKINMKKASDQDLLSVKLILEDISPEKAALIGDLSEGAVNVALRKAVKSGILLSPPSAIKRDISFYGSDAGFDEKMITADVFTLQWHITNVCDLHCKHCYDREKRSSLTLEKGINILEEMRDLCREKHVRGHICFSGGNPFMSPHFISLYRKAADMGFSTSILGNPVEEKRLDEVLNIQYPGYFQVSLEGLKEHNDYIRGEGFYDKVFSFLGVLKGKNVPSAVMLTLTKDNMDQVIPLAEELKGNAEYFTFNRLSAVGEGAKLVLPSPDEYENFLREYVEASRKNPIMGFKDNLLNIIREELSEPLFEGCTGYGCGAAFNFVTLLPDGEVHACRKFHSPIGNISENKLLQIYDSPEAAIYRRGCKGCDGCSIRHVCGGCLAVSSGSGVDIFDLIDPYCFKKTKKTG